MAGRTAAADTPAPWRTRRRLAFPARALQGVGMPSRYSQWLPSMAPARRVSCLWTRENAGGEAHRQLIVPDGCLDLVWHDGRIEVVGPDRAPRTVPVAGGTGFAGVRFRPGAAALLLGRIPVREVCDLQVPLEELLPRQAGVLAERLAPAGGPRAAVAVLDWFAASLPDGRAFVDRVVERAVAVLDRPGPLRLGQLACELGLSERQLRRRVTDAVGYGPRTLHRVLRFQRALALGRSGSLGLADIALRAGYADQAHFTREVRDLAGIPPGALLRPARPPQPGA